MVFVAGQTEHKLSISMVCTAVTLGILIHERNSGIHSMNENDCMRKIGLSFTALKDHSIVKMKFQLSNKF